MNTCTSALPGGKLANFHLFHHPIPRTFGVNDKLVPDSLLDLRLMSLFMVKKIIIAFDPNEPQHNASKEVPDHDHFVEFICNYSLKQSLLPIEAIIIADSNPTKFVHNECGQLPNPPSLNTIPKFMFDCFIHSYWEDRRHIA